MSRAISSVEIKPFLAALPSCRACMASILALATGLNWEVLSCLKIEDVYLPNGDPVECLAVKGRRSTRRHPFFRYSLSGPLRKTLVLYQASGPVMKMGASLFPSRPGRTDACTVRTLHRDVRVSLRACGLADECSPISLQKHYQEAMRAAFPDNIYLRRVACGKRLPRDSKAWKDEGQILVWHHQDLACLEWLLEPHVGVALRANL